MPPQLRARYGRCLLQAKAAKRRWESRQFFFALFSDCKSRLLVVPRDRLIAYNPTGARARAESEGSRAERQAAGARPGCKLQRVLVGMQRGGPSPP